MYLWKVDSLVDDFKSGNVTQREEFKYVLLSTLAMALAADPVIDIGSSYNYYDAFTSVLMFGISIFGIYFCYKINSSGDNRDFILRLMCIGVPVLIRVIAVFIPIMIIGAILEITLFANGSGDEKVYESTPIKVALTSALVASYYWYLSRKIRAVSS